MNDTNQYALRLDGGAFRAQRELLMKIADLTGRGQPYEPAPGDEELLDGLLELTDEISDQAHDRYGIECLLSGDEGKTGQDV
jgi:hypothetical protein